MDILRRILKPAVAVSLLIAAAAAPAQEADRVERLLDELADPENGAWQRTEQALVAEWSKSGSASMDLLLQRGREALEAEEWDTAIEHLTALTDHAPGFAEGWNLRAAAFFRSGRTGPALRDLQQALALNPDNFVSLIVLARIFEEIGRPEQALEAWRAVEAIHPHRPELEEAIERLEKETGGQTL